MQEDEIAVRESEGPRKFTRHPLIADIEYRSDSPILRARISDISIGGLFIDTVNTLDLGKTVTFSFSLPGEREGSPVTGEGVVSWRQETVGMGIRFTKMSRADWQRVKTYITGRA